MYMYGFWAIHTTLRLGALVKQYLSVTIVMGNLQLGLHEHQRMRITSSVFA